MTGTTRTTRTRSTERARRSSSQAARRDGANGPRGARKRKVASTRGDAQSSRALRAYRAKRDFAVTPEPRGARASSTAARAQEDAAEGARFVVQKHASRSLHYDFRLELDGVLLSWSVPKGPSLKTDEKRLAVRTEDHPLEYADFEGIIPKGEYGGGTVIVWDRGTWSCEGEAHAALTKGHLAFELHGDKLKGRFHLVRTRADRSKRENWLLFKGRDAQAQAKDAEEIVTREPESSLTGRTIEEVAEAPTRVWHSDSAKEAQTSSEKKKREETPDVVALVGSLNVGVEFTNLDKVLYAEQNLRKAELIAYYASVAGAMLPHIKGRPLTLVRCPDGRRKKCFYQKHAAAGVPSVLRRVSIAERDKTGTYLAVSDLAGLLALPQMGALEVHTWPCHADAVERPDQLVFDLDPGPDLPFTRVIDAARELRERLAELGLESFVKATGGKGLHVVLPVKRRLDWDTHKAFAFALADAMARESPKKYLTNMRKDLRVGRVFLDYLRNARGATAIAPYSTRAREGATVATPLSWDELGSEFDPRQFNVRTVLSRVNGVDPWRDYKKLSTQSIGAKALRRLGVDV